MFSDFLLDGNTRHLTLECILNYDLMLCKQCSSALSSSSSSSRLDLHIACSCL